MRRAPTKIAVILAGVAVALLLSACGGDDDKPTPSAAPADTAEMPTPGAAPPAAPGALPAEFLECMAEQGYEIESPDEIHSAPPQVLQRCFGALHGAGGAP